MRRAVSMAVGGALMLALAGCSGGGYPIFDREATVADVLPTELVALAGEVRDVRFLSTVPTEPTSI